MLQGQFEDQANLLGNVVSKENTVRYYSDGTASVVIDLLVKQKWQSGQGQAKEKSYYYRILLKGPLAELVGSEVKAGDSLYVRVSLANVKDRPGLLLAQFAQLVPKPAKLYWNKVHLSGRLKESGELRDSLGNKPMLQLKLDNGIEKSVIPVTLRGYGAQLAAKELAPGKNVLVEGSLQSKSIKLEESYLQEYWIEGFSCLVF